MKIYAFVKDTFGIVYAYFTHSGKRHKCVVWRQGDRYHVCTGMKIAGDLLKHNFSAAQTAAYIDFCNSQDYSIDYTEAIE